MATSTLVAVLLAVFIVGGVQGATIYMGIGGAMSVPCGGSPTGKCGALNYAFLVRGALTELFLGLSIFP